MTPNANQTSNTMPTPEHFPGWEHLPPAMRSIAQQSAIRKSGAIIEIKKKQQDANCRQEEEDQRRAEACGLRDEQEKQRREELTTRSKIVNDIARKEAKDEENYNKRREEACCIRDEKERKKREETKARAKIVLDLSGKEALLLQRKRLKACRLQNEQEHKSREENKTRGKIVHDIAKANAALEEENRWLEACRLRDEKEKQRRAASKARHQIVHDIVKEEAKDIEQEEKKRRAMACRLRDVQEQQRREETKVRAKVARGILQKSLEVNPANIEQERKKENFAPGEDILKNLKEEAQELRRRLEAPGMPPLIEIKDTFMCAKLRGNISKVDASIQETFKNYPYGLDDFRDLLEKRDEHRDALEKTDEFKHMLAKELRGVSDPKQQQETRSRVEDDIRAILANEEYKNQVSEEARQNWSRAKEAGQEAH
jgi:hypothetical protein